MPPITIADGLRTSLGILFKILLGTLTFPIIKEHISEIITVDELEIIKSTFTLWRALKVLVEPSSATVFAAL